MPHGPSRRRTAAAAALAALLAACSGGDGGPAQPSGSQLPPQPQLLAPAPGEQVATDTPTFTVRNAAGFDYNQGDYTFEVITPGALRVVATVTVPAGSGTTSATPGPLPRGMTLAWRVHAQSGVRSVDSPGSQTFRLPPVECGRLRNPYAKSVVSWHVDECSLRRNKYSDPDEVLGPPDAGGSGPDRYVGMMSLGEGGWVVVDMEGCAANGPGNDVRVYQMVGSEPVTLWAGGTPSGPWQLLQERIRCNGILPGVRAGSCEFDLAPAEIDEARYFKIQDGELFPCDYAGTVTEGADIDAIEILNAKP